MEQTNNDQLTNIIRVAESNHFVCHFDVIKKEKSQLAQNLLKQEAISEDVSAYCKCRFS